MYLKADLHMHTTASDGDFEPEQIVNIAKSENIDIISITDHDTTRGLQRAIEEGKDKNVRIIPGIELSSLFNDESIHILGYFKDDSYKSTDFQNFLTDLQEYRVWRAKKIIQNLNTYFGINITYDYVKSIAKGTIARPHIAKAIIDSGYEYSNEYLFNHIISKDSLAYVNNKDISISEGIKILKSVNAITVLAHPVLIKKSSVEDLLKFDFDGIEALYSLNRPEDDIWFCKLAEKYSKIVTAGSDFHGNGRHDFNHGSIGCRYLNSEGIEKFLNLL